MAGTGSTELRLKERQLIEELSKKGFRIGGIAQAIERSHSCVKQEIRRNGGRQNYNAINAQGLADARKEAKIIKISKGINQEEIKIIDSLINEGKSINQINVITGITNYRLAKYVKQNHHKYKRKNLIGINERLEQIDEFISIILEQIDEINKKLSLF